MLHLNMQGLQDRAAWAQAGIRLPRYDVAAVRARTWEAPAWLHFGAGNIFRGFLAAAQQTLLNTGRADTGILAAESFDFQIIDQVYSPYDALSLLVRMRADGSEEREVIASVAGGLKADCAGPDWARLTRVFCSPTLQMASFTITEKGYALTDLEKKPLPVVERDLAAGPEGPRHTMSIAAALLYRRFQAGGAPIAMVSMDNCSHNGSKLHDAVYAFAKKWSETGLTDKSFADYIENPAKVSFPWSMIDKITPRPDPSVEEILKKDGVEELEPVVTSKNTYVAPFVNAEECQYLVIEDAFPNGRPELEKGGLIFTTRETVDKVEKMKVCTCLNPLHTALAVFGCILGYDLISKEMKDETLKKLVEGIGYVEGLPVVINPGILDPKEFIDTVLGVRIPNPFMPDTPQRIATDTSQKLAIRFGETIKAYQASPELNVSDLKLIPLVFAGWLRYLMGVDDNGNTFELSPDPLLDTVRPYVADVKLGQAVDAEKLLKPVLENEKIFGVNLYEAGMADTVCSYFSQMTAGTGAVRSTLEKYV